MKSLLLSGRRRAEVLIRRRFDGFDNYAIHRACHGTLVASNAIIDIDIEAIPCPLRHFEFGIRILCRHVGDEQVLDRDLHPDRNRVEREPDIVEVDS
jgi:hypothetical protein